ncbi:alpha/beta fold hydrolase [Microbacteriaceae bacterium VKM Ac-2855]|nr:alpha/beta fold hydrolase [Microbacteriaceae bacterium VKM Ac-2855]
MAEFTAKPFRLNVAEGELHELQRRLGSARYPHPLPGDDWSRGVPSAVLERYVAHWRTAFSWRAIEERVNEHPQFTTVIDGQTLHYLHVPSSRPDAAALVLLHGWPGSFLEFLELIEPLTNPPSNEEPAFHVVIPSIPGFGFSTPLADRDWNEAAVASVIAELMAGLGYERYVAQGGDYGAGVAPELARADPQHCVAVHVNGSIGAPFEQPSEEELERSTEVERDRFRRVGEFMQNEFGYISIQSTRPALVGEILADSPTGQLAWLLDKFWAWTFPFDTDPAEILGYDRILAHATLYWLSRCAGTAAYIVYAADSWGAQAERPEQPVGAIMFAHDIGIRRYAEREFTITRWTEVEGRGGHFAAMEEPEALVADIRAFVAESVLG